MNETQNMELDKLVRYLIGAGLVKTDDMPNSDAPAEAIQVINALRSQVARLEKRLHELTCNECDSRILDDGNCMMGHWCGKSGL